MCPIEEMPVGSMFVVDNVDGVFFEVINKEENIKVKITRGDLSQIVDAEPGILVKPIWFPVWSNDE